MLKSSRNKAPERSKGTTLGTLDLNGFNQEIAGLSSVAGTNAGLSNNVVTSATAALLTLNVSGAQSSWLVDLVQNVNGSSDRINVPNGILNLNSPTLSLALSGTFTPG